MRKLSLAVPILIAFVSLTSCNGNGPEENGSELEENMPVMVDVKPMWKDLASPRELSPVPDSSDFIISWDLSIPMAGSIHRTVPDSQYTLQEVHDLVLNAKLVSDYKDPRISLKCMNMVSLAPIACDIDLTKRSAFRGTSSEIHNGIQFAINGLMNGSIVGAAFISDLMATDSIGKGATVLLPYLEDLKVYFDKGEIHMTILGIRPIYWGVKAGECEGLKGDLGCWFDEGRKKWRKLTERVNRPIYILVVGRSINEEDDRKDDNPIVVITERARETLVKRGFDVQSEVITLGALGIQTDFVWSSQTTNLRLGPSGYHCRTERSSPLTAKFKEGEIDQISIDGKNLIDSLDVFDGLEKYGKGGVKLELDCKSVSNIRRGGRKNEICNDDGRDWTIKPEFSEAIIEFNYKNEEASRSDWMMWSTSSPLQGNPSLTLYLVEFITGLRPSSGYKANISPVPPLSCR